jgi:hypothetical protein
VVADGLRVLARYRVVNEILGVAEGVMPCGARPACTTSLILYQVLNGDAWVAVSDMW